MKPVLPFALLLAAQHLFAQGFVLSPYQDFSLSSPVVADFNGDGRPDVLGIQFSGPPHRIVLQTNNGGSVIAFTEQNLNLNFETSGKPTAADFDDDGDLDVVVVKGAANHLFLLTNDGLGNFTLDSLGVSGANQFKTADMDGDNDPDIVGIDAATGALLLFVNEGNQQFSTIPILAGSANLEVFDIGDLDNDGDPDVVLGFDQFSGKQLVVYKNNGNNTFEEVVVANSQYSNLADLCIDDLDGDGQRDIVAVRAFNGDVFLNKGNLTFELKNLFFPSGIIRKVVTGDYNGDGRRDVIIGYNSISMTWHKNLSNSPLEFDTETAGTVSPVFSLVNSDLDSDGDTDFVVTNGEFWWYENQIPQKPSSTRAPDDDAFDVYPNPFQDVLRIKNTGGAPYRILLTDSRGQQVLTDETTRAEISLSGLPEGVYFLRLTNTETQQIRNMTLIKNK